MIAERTKKVFIFAKQNHYMKKLVAWAKANPFLATITGVAIVTGLILLGRYLTKDKAPEAPAEPTPTPNPERTHFGWQRAFRTSTAGVSSNVGAGMSGK